MVIRPLSVKPRINTPSERRKTACQKPQPRKIAWEIPQPKEIRVTARYEAVGGARVAVELEADKLGGYHFGHLRWEILEGSLGHIVDVLNEGVA